MLLIDKFLTEPQKALFYIHQTVVNGWSRNVLHKYIDSSLYERQGKALSNFTRTLPEVGSDLAQEITRDPYNFAFTGITKPYNERILKDALLNNITKFLTNRTWYRFCLRRQGISLADWRERELYRLALL